MQRASCDRPCAATNQKSDGSAGADCEACSGHKSVHIVHHACPGCSVPDHPVQVHQPHRSAYIDSRRFNEVASSLSLTDMALLCSRCSCSFRTRCQAHKPQLCVRRNGLPFIPRYPLFLLPSFQHRKSLSCRTMPVEEKCSSCSPGSAPGHHHRPQAHHPRC